MNVGIEEAISNVIRYLKDLQKEGEVIYDITDRMAKAKSHIELAEALYSALRLKGKIKEGGYIPSEDDIRRILDYVKNSINKVREVGLKIAAESLTSISQQQQREGEVKNHVFEGNR